MKINAKRLAVVLLSMLAGHLAMAIRLGILLAPLKRFTLWRLFKAVLIGLAGNNVLPLRMGELLRVDYLARHGNVPHSACLAAVAVDRLFDLICLATLVLGLIPLAAVGLPGTATMITAVALLSSVLGGLWGIARRPERFAALCRRCTHWMGHRASTMIGDKATLFAHGLASLQSPSRALAAMGMSYAYWFASIATIRAMLWVFGFSLPWYASAIVLAFIAFAVTLPSAPAFIGTYHYFAATALVTLGIPQASATSFAIVLHASGVVPFTLVAVLFVLAEVLRGQLPLSLPAFQRHPAPSVPSEE